LARFFKPSRPSTSLVVEPRVSYSRTFETFFATMKRWRVTVLRRDRKVDVGPNMGASRGVGYSYDARKVAVTSAHHCSPRRQPARRRHRRYPANTTVPGPRPDRRGDWRRS
jgi:hypothetical protein